MLQKIIKHEYAQKILKILLRNQLTVIIEYPSYKVLAYSSEMSDKSHALGQTPKETKHHLAEFSTEFGNDATPFRLKKMTSKWLMIFKRASLGSLELFQVDDTPIFHGNQLIGICCTFKNIALNDISLINKLLNHTDQEKNPDITSDDADNKLSTLEKEILFFAALNKSNKQISSLQSKLGIRNINYSTVKTTVSQRIYQKLNTTTIDDAVIKAIESKQIETIPESILSAMLKDYYLIEATPDFISL